MHSCSKSAVDNPRAGFKPALRNAHSNDFYPGYRYYTKTGRTVNTIKNGLPQIRGAASFNGGSLERFDFVNLVRIRVNDMNTAGNARIKGMHCS